MGGPLTLLSRAGGDAPYRWYTKLQEGDVVVGVLGQSNSITDSTYTLTLQLEVLVATL